MKALRLKRACILFFSEVGDGEVGETAEDGSCLSPVTILHRYPTCLTYTHIPLSMPDNFHSSFGAQLAYIFLF